MSANSQPSIVLHHLNASRSQRIFWVLEELGLPYDVKVHWRQPDARSPESLKRVCTAGKAPVLELNGEKIAESAYIIHRLLQLAASGAQGIKANDVELVPSHDSIYWGHWAEGTQMIGLVCERILGATVQGFAAQLPDGEGKQTVLQYGKFTSTKHLQPGNRNALDEMEQWLQTHEWFSGTQKPGLGDFMLQFAIFSMVYGARKGIYEPGPKTQEWLQRCMARPACKRALERLQREEEAQKASL